MTHRITAFLKFGAALAVGSAMLAGCDSGAGSGAQSVHAVGSSTVYPFAKLVAENFVRSHPDMRSPLIESTGTGNGIQLFCSGLGPNTPDMVNASRRMKASEFDTCTGNGVDEVIELQVGLDGIAFASAKGGIMLNLSPEAVYRRSPRSPMASRRPPRPGRTSTRRSRPTRSSSTARPPPRGRAMRSRN